MAGLLTLALAGIAVWAWRAQEVPDATGLVALAAADWARGGGDPAECVGVAEEGSDLGIAVHCGVGDARRSYHFDASGALLPVEPGT